MKKKISPMFLGLGNGQVNNNNNNGIIIKQKKKSDLPIAPLPYRKQLRRRYPLAVDSHGGVSLNINVRKKLNYDQNEMEESISSSYMNRENQKEKVFNHSRNRTRGETKHFSWVISLFALIGIFVALITLFTTFKDSKSKGKSHPSRHRRNSNGQIRRNSKYHGSDNSLIHTTKKKTDAWNEDEVVDGQGQENVSDGERNKPPQIPCKQQVMTDMFYPSHNGYFRQEPVRLRKTNLVENKSNRPPQKSNISSNLKAIQNKKDASRTLARPYQSTSQDCSLTFGNMDGFENCKKSEKVTTNESELNSSNLHQENKPILPSSSDEELHVSQNRSNHMNAPLQHVYDVKDKTWDITSLLSQSSLESRKGYESSSCSTTYESPICSSSLIATFAAHPDDIVNEAEMGIILDGNIDGMDEEMSIKSTLNETDDYSIPFASPFNINMHERSSMLFLQEQDSKKIQEQPLSSSYYISKNEEPFSQLELCSSIPYNEKLKDSKFNHSDFPNNATKHIKSHSIIADGLNSKQMESDLFETNRKVRTAIEYNRIEENAEDRSNPHVMEKMENKKISPFQVIEANCDSDNSSSGETEGANGIIHKRKDLTAWTNAASSLTSTIPYSDLKMESVIGGGGFGQVWKATWRGTPVAVKVFSASAQVESASKALLQEFAAEINLVSAMRHPNICLYIGACLESPHRAIVSELAANGSLWDSLRQPLSPPFFVSDGKTQGTWPLSLYAQGKSQVLTHPKHQLHLRKTTPIPPTRGSWPWFLVKRVAAGAARGMIYLHSGEPAVLHRDLKSANILLDETYNAKVTDFGLSRLKAQERSMTGNCGTVQWMAPEILSDQGYAEPADVYSFGIILWELLSRECPYEKMPPIQCALAVLNKDLRPEIPEWCPPVFESLIKTCLESDPMLRPTFPQILMTLDELD